MRKLCALALAIVAASASTAKAGPPTGADVPYFRCAEVITAEGEWTDKTIPLTFWLAGYRDGIGALGNIDPRFKSIGTMDSKELGAAVLVICQKKQNMTVAEATAAVFEMMINALPGRDVISLALPERP
jgi:hypothetical protein